uniref:Uncharacterized protein n=1 Tax=Haptolina brevifila TaxID=156173 RepID=A0A7S2DG34_9EUKA
MSEASERRGGLGLLFALTKEDASQGGSKGLIALLPTAHGSGDEGGSGDEDQMEEAALILAAISGVPALPAALASNRLFQAQRIEEEGFGICWERVEGAPQLRASKLREAATRKTLMPALLQL